MEQQTAAPDLSGIEARIGELAGTVKTLTERTDKMEAKANRPGAIETKGADTEVKSFNTFVRKGKEALGADEVKSLRVADDTSGGYLAPAQFVAELMKNLVLYSPVRSVARVAPTGQGAVILPKRTGTTTAAWVGETEDRPETAPAYGQAEYTVRELSAYIDISNTMLEDAAFDMAAELASDFAEEFGKAEGAAFVNGNGVKKPMGFMADSAVLHTLNGHATNLSSDALVKLFHDTPGAYAANGVWMMNRTTIGVVRTLKDGAGRYLWQEPLSAGNPATILGRPVAEAPDMDDVAAGAFPIAFGDFRQGYRIFDRVALSVLRDPYSQATKGMTRFHARRRVAGGVGKAEAIRKLKMATS